MAAAKTPLMRSGGEGGNYLVWLYASVHSVCTQVGMSTTECIAICSPTVRRLDVVVDDVAHDSKVGYLTLTHGIRQQIESDTHLAETAQIEPTH